MYLSDGGYPKKQITPKAPTGEFWNWTRKEIASFLIDQIKTEPVMIGIDHGLSFSLGFFKRHDIRSWREFINEFPKHWPTDQDHTYVDTVREDNKTTWTGSPDEFRLTERWTSSAKSVFRFDVQGQVAKSTHAGLPWIKHILDECGDAVHVWPFDGWVVPEVKSMIAEVYPSIFRNRYPRDERTVDEQDAFAVCQWLKDTDQNGFMDLYLSPALTDRERRVVEREGWILGVM